MKKLIDQQRSLQAELKEDLLWQRKQTEEDADEEEGLEH